ncbi:MAG: lactonase family protein [Eubacterium sp.]|nr:lactonase family protein [Eubacterium sp.]
MKKYAAYIGTYTTEDHRGLHIMDLDEETGSFKEVKSLEIDNPAHLCVSTSGKYLYCTTDLGVASFKIKKDGDLEEMNQRWVGGLRGAHISTDRDDEFLFVAGYYDGRVTVMRLNPDGSVGDIAGAVFHKGMGRTVGRRNLEPHVNCVTITPDQKFLCAVDNGLDCIKVYDLNRKTGAIELADNVHMPMDTAPRHMLFSADGKYAYVICELTSEIFVYEYTSDGKAPNFEKIQTIASHDPDDHSASAGVEIMISPDKDQKFVYTSNAGINTTSIFRRDPKTGLLTYVGGGMVGGHYPKTISIFPDQLHFASLNYDSDQVNFFKFVNNHQQFLECARPIKVSNPNTCRIVDLSLIDD